MRLQLYLFSQVPIQEFAPTSHASLLSLSIVPNDSIVVGNFVMTEDLAAQLQPSLLFVSRLLP